jgi:Ser/Thr protein kinase RdoA (MazF antagonist)
MPGGGSSDATFTSSSAWEILTKACVALGLPSDGAELMRLGENAIFRLSSKPLVVRIGRSLEKLPVVERELCVAHWLADEGVSVVRPYDGVAQPVVIADQHPVSVWHLVEAGRNRPWVEDLAPLLRQMHALGDCPCDLPALDPLTRAQERLRAVGGLNEDDRTFLLSRLDELRRAFDEVKFVLPPGFIHGDAHTGNLLGEAGNAVLGDFEAVANGPREWDLVAVAMSVARFGLSLQVYERFVELYGFDVLAWEGYGVLRDMRELYMTAWLAQNLAEGPDVVAEVALRIASIRDGDTSCEWHAF